MSTLKVTNIQATGETASRAVSGVAAAWYHLDNDYTASLSPNGGNVSIQDSFNTSSITDNGTGNYSMAWTNSFDNALYSNSLLGQYLSDSAAYEYGFMASIINAPTASGYSFTWRYYSNSYYDPSKFWAVAHGDLA